MIWNCVEHLPSNLTSPGYKVGRVDQSETALGAEMRVANDKGKGKVKENKEKEKIVRRFVVPSLTTPSS